MRAQARHVILRVGIEQRAAFSLHPKCWALVDKQVNAVGLQSHGDASAASLVARQDTQSARTRCAMVPVRVCVAMTFPPRLRTDRVFLAVMSFRARGLPVGMYGYSMQKLLALNSVTKIFRIYSSEHQRK